MCAPDINTVYYVFSTIAQALAGIVGVLAAFAVLRLSMLSGRLAEELPALASYCQCPEVFRSCVAEGDYAGAIDQINRDGLSGTDDVLVLTVCERAERERAALVRTLRRTLVASVSVIALSVLCLILARAIASSPWVTWSAFIVGFAGLVACLVLVVGQVIGSRRNASRSSKSDTKCG